MTEIEIEGVGTYRLPNDWQYGRLGRMKGEKRHTAVLAFGCGMTCAPVHQAAPGQAAGGAQGLSGADVATGGRASRQRRRSASQRPLVDRSQDQGRVLANAHENDTAARAFRARGREAAGLEPRHGYAVHGTGKGSPSELVQHICARTAAQQERASWGLPCLADLTRAWPARIVFRKLCGRPSSDPGSFKSSAGNRATHAASLMRTRRAARSARCFPFAASEHPPATLAGRACKFPEVRQFPPPQRRL